MHSILLGNEMAPPVRRDSVVWVENTLTVFTDDDAISLPSDDDISSLPHPSSPLPDIDEFDEQFKPVRVGSPSSLPDSSPPASPIPYEDDEIEEDSPNGHVYLFDKAGADPLFFKIPSTNGYFCLLNSRAFVEQSRIITHSLKVYDAMLASFVDLPPTAYWRQVPSAYHYLILKDEGIKDAQCIGLGHLIHDLDDPVDVMAIDQTCLNIWRQKQVAPLPTQAPVQKPSNTAQGKQSSVGEKRKWKRSVSEDEVEVSGPPVKMLKFSQKGSGSKGDPIIIFNN